MCIDLDFWVSALIYFHNLVLIRLTIWLLQSCLVDALIQIFSLFFGCFDLRHEHEKLCDDIDVVNYMATDDEIGKNSRKLNPCNWLQKTQNIKNEKSSLELVEKIK